MTISFNNSTNCSNSAIDLCRSVQKLRTNDNYRPRSAIYNESRILDFDEHRKKKERFRMNKLHWEQIPRANNPSKPLQEKAVNLLAVIVHKLQKMEVVTLNHNYLSRITKCGKDQNVNLLRQLDDVLDISFHAKFTIGKTIHRNCYVIQHTEKGRATIENPEVLLTQKHFVGNIAVSSIEKTSTEDKKDTSCAEFFPSFSIYKEEVLENRSNKSNFYKNSFEEEKILQSPTESICNKAEEIMVVTANQINNTFAKSGSKRKPQIFPKIFKAKELKDFYPLTRDDCQKLQSSSKREFSLNAMNEILLDMSKRLTNGSIPYFNLQESNIMLE